MFLTSTVCRKVLTASEENRGHWSNRLSLTMNSGFITEGVVTFFLLSFLGGWGVVHSETLLEWQ